MNDHAPTAAQTDYVPGLGSARQLLRLGLSETTVISFVAEQFAVDAATATETAPGGTDPRAPRGPEKP